MLEAPRRASFPAADRSSRACFVAPVPPAPVPTGTKPEAPTPTVLVCLDDLVTGHSPRVAGVDPEHVRLLADLEVKLPPVLVHRRTMKVIDGEHRVQAARLKGETVIEVEFFTGDEAECLLRAVEANIRNGLPLTLRDRRESARRIIAVFPDWSDRLVATKVGLASKTVAVVRSEHGGGEAQPTVRIGADGRARPLSLAEGRIRASEVLVHHPDASLREIARAAGISVGTARDVRERVKQGRSPLPDGMPLQREVATEAKATAPVSIDLGTVLDSLKRDPVLRYSDDGRVLIRWLDSRIIRSEEIGLAQRVPPHRAGMVAQMARACASRWQDIATGLERLATVADHSE